MWLLLAFIQRQINRSSQAARICNAAWPAKRDRSSVHPMRMRRARLLMLSPHGFVALRAGLFCVTRNTRHARERLDR
jgi:hypothetical protein